MKSIHVCIIDADIAMRHSCVALIEIKSHHKVVGVFSSFKESEKKILGLQPDVFLLDIDLPGKNGIDSIPLIKKILPGAQVIVLALSEKEELIFKALRNGASGYLLKNSHPEKIIAAIEEVVESGGSLSPSVASIVIKSFRKNIDSPLSKRETEILEHFAAGKSRKKIAEEIFLDTQTVKTHLRNIYLKLDVHSKADAIKLARAKKFI